MFSSTVVGLCSQNLLHKFGYYRLILITFYVEAGAAVIMLLLGPGNYYFLALFLTSNMWVITQNNTVSFALHLDKGINVLR